MRIATRDGGTAGGAASRIGWKRVGGGVVEGAVRIMTGFGSVGRRLNTIVAGTAVVVGLSGCDGSDGAAVSATAPVPVVVAAAEQRELPVVIREVGVVESTGAVTIQSRIDGEIVKVFVADGQEVKAGAPLIQIDPAPLDIQLRIARATLARDEATLANAVAKERRGDALLAQKFISVDAHRQLKTDREFAKATVDADRAAVDNAALQLSYATIRAPVAGKIGHVSQQVGNLIRAVAQTPLVTLNVLDSVDVAFSIPQSQLTVVRTALRKAPPTVRASSSDADSSDVDPPAATGTLTFVDNAADPTTGTIKLRARFDNRARTLWPGAYVDVSMALPVNDRSIVVPTVAIGHGPNGPYVYVVSESIAEQRAVQVGRASEDLTIVVGVRAGELVVVDGQSRLSPNARVAIFPARPA